MRQTSSIWFTFDLEGFHEWNTIPVDHTEQYLKTRHRHLFKIRVDIQVNQQDRELEFISLRREVKSLLYHAFGLPAEFGTKSCEMIGEEIMKIVKQLVGIKRDIQVSVSEDGENGAIILYSFKEDKHGS